MATLAASFLDQDAGIAPASLQKQTGCFDQRIRFLGHNGINDEWLDEYNTKQHAYLLSAFSRGLAW